MTTLTNTHIKDMDYRLLNMKNLYHEEIEERKRYGRVQTVNYPLLMELDELVKAEIIVTWSKYHKKFNAGWMIRILNKLYDDILLTEKEFLAIHNIILDWKIDLDFWLERR